MYREMTQSIEAILEPVLGELNVDLIEIKVVKNRKTFCVSILADKPEGGITVEECARLNKKITRAIEERQCLGEDYQVEVCSPGLDRRLSTARDFQRVLRRPVRVHLHTPLNEKLEYHGEVVGVDGEQVKLNVNGQIVTVPLEKVSKAVQMIE